MKAVPFALAEQVALAVYQASGEEILLIAIP